ncbi:MAG: TMEM165/GDT1 family protein [Acidimicrobiia bacterium]|nr:TMEM165/GDT1 family protein [Acidimicrobiia bacterium]
MDAALLAFAVVFVAELGDKTQLVALGLAARYRLSVVLTGVGLAYVVTQGLAALLGGALGAALPTTAIGMGAALLFFAFAAWTIYDALGSDDGEAGDAESEAVEEVEAVAAKAGRTAVGIVAGIVGAMVLAELGDKSMLATATVAADRGALGAWVGATLGISAAGGLAVLVGRVLGARIPERTTRLVSAALFVLFGALLLADTVA